MATQSVRRLIYTIESRAFAKYCLSSKENFLQCVRMCSSNSTDSAGSTIRAGACSTIYL